MRDLEDKDPIFIPTNTNSSSERFDVDTPTNANILGGVFSKYHW
mgnify:CR=1 FL=1